MDDDTAALIAELCTRAGMLMEDVLDHALTMGGAVPEERTSRLEELAEASARIGTLIAAAQAIALTSASQR